MVLRQLGAASLLAAPVAAAALAHAGKPDAELIALGSEFERHYAEYLALCEQSDRACAILDDEAQQMGLTRGGLAWFELRKQRGAEAANKITNDKAEELDKIAKRIRAIPATSIIGLAVKASLLPFTVYNMEDEIALKNGAPMNDMDWVTQCLHDFVAEIRRMAGGSDV